MASAWQSWPPTAGMHRPLVSQRASGQSVGSSLSRVREETYTLPTRQGWEAFKQGWDDPLFRV